MKDKMSSPYIMPNKIKTIINSTLWMLFLAFIALLLHPLLYFDGIRFYMDCPSYFFLHIFAYTIFGNLIWNVLKHKAWWISALAIVAGVNIVLLIYIYFFVKSQRGETGGCCQRADFVLYIGYRAVNKR